MEENAGPAAEPRCLFWFKVYAGFMVFLYALVLVAGVVLVALPDRGAEGPVLGLMGGLYILLGAVFAVGYLVPFFLKPSPFAWIYDLVLICIGFSGCPTVFAAVALLIFWIKPETKAHFGKS